jgi:O-antigen ligase
MENSYAEVLHKQGMLGLGFYLALLVVVVRAYRLARERADPITANTLLSGVLYIYLLSTLNPFITNSIGMSFVAMALASLEALCGRVPLARGAEGRANGFSLSLPVCSR